MHKPIQIGITGGIGSGKSIITRIFSTLGVPVYDADSHAKKLMTTDGILMTSIQKEFGDLSYHADGSLNRTYLADHVFNDEQQLQRLNALVHPRVAADFAAWVNDHRDHRYVLKEAALIYEANTQASLEAVVVVSAPLELRVKRVLKRDKHRTVEQIGAIVEKQLPEEVKLEHADFIIVNDESQLVIPQVLRLHETFRRMAGA